MSASAIPDFLAAMRERGLEPAEEIIADGALHRIRWKGDTSGRRNGSYVLHLNGHPAGYFGCWKRGINVTWSAKGSRLSPAERKAFNAKATEDRRVREQEERERHQLASKTAQATLAACKPAEPDHPYLTRKGIQPHGALADAAGNLVLPLRDAKGTVWSVQTIAPDGAKLFLKGGRKRGLYHVLGEPDNELVIAEGFATAASIREATGLPVIIAWDAGNISPVARAVREWLPLARIVIAADDDFKTAGNPGLTKAQAAAELVSANVAIPTFSEDQERGTDFNDMAQAGGLEPVAEIIRAAFAVELDAEQVDEEEPAQGTGPDPEQYADAEPAADPQPAQDDWEQPLLNAVAELNEKHFVVPVSGQTVIASLENDTTLKRETLIYSREQDVKLRYRHRHYHVGFTQKGSPIWKDLGTAWLEHRKRRNFDRIALIPKGPCPPTTFNLWRGLGVEPKPGDWPLIKQHLLEVVCSGDLVSYDWMIGWLARAVQHPELHAEVAVVLRGLKGTGKGTLGQMLYRIFRHHGLQISNPAHFTGRFNGHLADVLFLFVDEAYWGGDRAGEGTLKGLVTEAVIPIEQKFVNLYQVPNRLKILMASNNDWVVPTTADERRYFVLDVSDCRKGDREYFKRLNEAISGAELPAFLDYLLGLDISGFDFRNPPHTAALNHQKIVGADSLTKFWLDCLTAGEIVGSELHGWPCLVPRQALHDAYVDHAHDHGDRRPLAAAIMAKRLKELLPGGRLQSYRPRQGDRERCYQLDGLDQCRDAFLKAQNIDVYDWPEDGE